MKIGETISEVLRLQKATYEWWGRMENGVAQRALRNHLHVNGKHICTTIALRLLFSHDVRQLLF